MSKPTIKEIAEYLEKQGVEPIVITGTTDKELRVIYNAIKGGNEMNKEIWVDIGTYEGLYQISDEGNIKGFDRVGKFGKQIITYKGKLFKGCLNPEGYLNIKLSKNNHKTTYLVHRLVAIHFIPNPLNKRTVNHKNGNKQDNRVENLEWATDLENIQHAWDNGIIKRKLTIAQVREIREKYKNGTHIQKELSNEYKVSVSNISSIVRRKIWKNI